MDKKIDYLNIPVTFFYNNDNNKAFWTIFLNFYSKSTQKLCISHNFRLIYLLSLSDQKARSDVLRNVHKAWLIYIQL